MGSFRTTLGFLTTTVALLGCGDDGGAASGTAGGTGTTTAPATGDASGEGGEDTVTATTQDSARDTQDTAPADDLPSPGPCPDGPESEGCSERSLGMMQVSVSELFMCGRQYGGLVQCWGNGMDGVLGNGSTLVVGDQPWEIPPVPVNLGGYAEEVRAGQYHVCARLDTGKVRCWGWNLFGQLGYGHTNSLGDQPGEMPTPDVNVGAPVIQLAVGSWHTCALLQDGHVRCWGGNEEGQLGYGHTNSIGDQPGEMPPPNVPGISGVTQLVAGARSTCALSSGPAAVRCWGSNEKGQLGIGHTNIIGDGPGEMPPPAVSIGIFSPTQITAGSLHFCALTSIGVVKCWGNYEAMGVPGFNNIGDHPGDLPLPAVNVGGFVTQVASNRSSVCAILDTGKVRCWGGGYDGQLGYANTNNIGDLPGEMPPNDVQLGPSATLVLSSGALGRSRCALDRSRTLRCWGYNEFGQLGYGHTNDIGDNEHPISAGAVPY